MEQKQVKELIENEKSLELIREVKRNLISSGLAGVMQSHGTFDLNALNAGGSAPEQVAIRASWFAGYNEALQDIMNFSNKYVQPAAITSMQGTVPDFGGAKAALDAGDITEEEYNRIRLGKES